MSATRGWQIAVVIGILSAWFLAGRYSATWGDLIGDPTLVAQQLLDWTRTGEIFRHIGTTALEAVIGFVVGAGLGAGVAFVLGFVPFLRRLLDPLIGIVAVVPRIVLAPVFMVWFGLGVTSKAALAATIVFFIVYFNVESGLRNVSDLLVDRARTMGAGWRDLLREIYIPACLVWIMSGLRISVGFAFLGVIVAEYLGANSGIGSLIATGQSMNDPNTVMAGLIVILIIVTPLDRLLSRVETRAAAWRG